MTAPRILVVDDEKLIRWSLGERLTRSGYDVAAAESGEEALDKLRGGPADVMLLDVRLPGIDGLDTLRRALAMQPELIVLMMSAHSTVDIAVEGMRRGAIDFLVKPFALGALDVAVKRALDAVSTRHAPAGDLVGDGLAGVRGAIGRIAAADGPVLIEGETGSGKELAARCIHARGPRAALPFVHLSCASLPGSLLEASAAGAGTLLLADVADLGDSAQERLLRLLDGGTAARIVATSSADLRERAALRRFRPDLALKLDAARLHMPALREHIEDLPQIAAALMAQSKLRGISPSALDLMMAYRWPGNVRELRNVIDRALILYGDTEELRPEHLPPEIV